ncbi:MAG: hypothetical protein K9W46_14040 [Candidatus Heimdallarchaeum endolithica]|uniref:CARDB domain-containing protein n=1 Tax=Candidatus Heimdallarchaeum endolithica TaxID=2876572 RepID=A0A9Y1BR86_9ARCH|nr:MAG: hypothetical protein K9W46_14040 [Candidatus Heimdallarchaeum endolithica]
MVRNLIVYINILLVIFIISNPTIIHNFEEHDSIQHEISTQNTDIDLNPFVKQDIASLNIQWTFSAGFFHSSPNVFDIDQDGTKEIVIGSGDHNFYVLDSDGNIEWTTSATWLAHTQPAIGDIDLDGNIEFIVGSDDDYIRCFTTDSTTPEWTYQLANDASRPIVIADIDDHLESPALEILTISYTGNFYVLNSDGSLRFQKTGINDEASHIVVADIDNDFNLEIIVGSGNNINIYDKAGVLEKTIDAGIYVDSIIVADFFSPGELAIGVASPDDNLVKVIAYNETVLFSHDIGSGVRALLPYDIDDDGHLDLLVAATDGMHAISENGELWHLSSGESREPVIGDIDNDGELEALYCTNPDYLLRVVDLSTGVQEWSYNIGEVITVPVIEDIDGDNKLEVLVSSRNGNLYCFEGAFDGHAEISSLGGNIYNNPLYLVNKIKVYKTPSTPNIDGSLNDYEYNTIFTSPVYSEDGGIRYMTFYLGYDNDYLYVGIDSKLADGWDSKAAVVIDGDIDNMLYSSLNSPYCDFKTQKNAPSGWSGYNGETRFNFSQETSITIENLGKSVVDSTNGLTYEWKIPKIEFAKSSSIQHYRIQFFLSENAVETFFFPYLHNHYQNTFALIELVPDDIYPTDVEVGENYIKNSKVYIAWDTTVAYGYSDNPKGVITDWRVDDNGNNDPTDDMNRIRGDLTGIQSGWQVVVRDADWTWVKNQRALGDSYPASITTYMDGDNAVVNIVCDWTEYNFQVTITYTIKPDDQNVYVDINYETYGLTTIGSISYNFAQINSIWSTSDPGEMAWFDYYKLGINPEGDISSLDTSNKLYAPFEKPLYAAFRSSNQSWIEGLIPKDLTQIQNMGMFIKNGEWAFDRELFSYIHNGSTIAIGTSNTASFILYADNTNSFDTMENVVDDIQKTQDLDTKTPFITSVTHTPSAPTENDAVVISADITDESGIQVVTLHYLVNSGNWSEENMTLVSDSTYEATIGPFDANDIIKYYIVAVDNSSNHNKATNDNDKAYYSFSVTTLDKIAPSITSVTHTPSAPTENDAIVISANVTDNVEVVSVTLFYRINGSSWVQEYMVSNGSVYSASIGPFEANAKIDFYIKATDSSNNEETTSISSFIISSNSTDIRENSTFIVSSQYITFLCIPLLAVFFKKKRRI